MHIDEIIINDKQVFNKTFTPDLDFLINELKTSKDRRRLYIGKLEFEI